jgi:hypothetical protein
MKSFKQFLNESYLSEEPAGRPAKKRTGGPSYDEVKAEIDAKEAEKAARKAQRGPTGAAADTTKQFRPQATTTNVSGSDVRGETGKGGALALRPKSGALATVKSSDAPSKTPKSGALATRPTSTPTAPVGTPSNPERIYPTPTNSTKSSSSGGKPPALSSGSKPKAPKLPSGASSAAKEAEKVAAKAATKTVGKGLLRGAGKLIGPASAVLDVADERSKGSGWLRSLAKGATVAAGGALGGVGGSALPGPGTVAGAIGGSMAASKAFDTVAGANAKERKAIATTNRQGQSGGALKGVGGKTTFDTKKNTITSGGKTAQLGKTSVVTDPKTGKQEVGNLAYKGGKAVYKRSDTKSLAQTSSNPLERIGRSLFAGAYKKSDTANAAKKLATARQRDGARNKALGVKMLPGK